MLLFTGPDVEWQQMHQSAHRSEVTLLCRPAAATAGKAQKKVKAKAPPKIEDEHPVTDEELNRAVPEMSPGGNSIGGELMNRLLGRHRPACARDQHTHVRANKTCEDNPHCLYGLGERNKGIWAPDYKTAAEQEQPPECADLRDGTSGIVGLKNQGVHPRLGFERPDQCLCRCHLLHELSTSGEMFLLRCLLLKFLLAGPV